MLTQTITAPTVPGAKVFPSPRAQTVPTVDQFSVIGEHDHARLRGLVMGVDLRDPVQRFCQETRRDAAGDVQSINDRYLLAGPVQGGLKQRRHDRGQREGAQDRRDGHTSASDRRAVAQGEPPDERPCRQQGERPQSGYGQHALRARAAG